MGLAGSSFPNGFTNGILIRGLPLHQVNPGEVFYVNGSTTLAKGAIAGSNSNDGTYRKPFATWLYAISRCVAGRGDIVVLMPNHTESVTAAAGIILSKAGVATIGLGIGASRPTITFTTANTATITVTANNVTVYNVLFIGGFLNVATCFSIANAQVATDFTVDSCEFRDSSTILNFVACVKVGTTANIADGLNFSNNKVFGVAATPAAGTTAVVLASDTKRVVLDNNFANHEVVLASTAVLLDGGALNHTQLLVTRNKTFRPNTVTTGELINSSSTACSGIVSDNYVAHLDNSGGLMIPVSTKLAFFRNFSMITGAADKSALENPAAV